jgi:biotin-dependent carboxylase-like uncharacterized protein
MIEVVDAGGYATVQDRGRPGLAHLGVPPSGALDAAALDLGNRLVGNPADAAGIEMTIHGATLRFHRAATIALVGASAQPRIDAAGTVTGAPVRIAPGQTLTVGPLVGGCRAYLAVRGGIDVTPVLGSRATDSLTGLGPPPLTAGRQLPIGDAAATWVGIDFAVESRYDAQPTLGVFLGPRAGLFTALARERLLSEPFTVSSDSNRVALRLDGPRLERIEQHELHSEGIVTGTIQVPPSAQPILFLNDHPTTGGYPVIGVVRTADMAAAAQLRPGDSVRFRAATRARNEEG